MSTIIAGATNIPKSQTVVTGLNSVIAPGYEDEKGGDVIMFKWGSLQKPFRCQLCDMLFEDGERLKEHIDKHLVNAQPSSKPFPCKICPKAFQSNKSLERHTQMHYGQVQKRCKFCYKVFSNKENLDRHMLTHNGQKPYKCPECPEQFVYRQGLNTHMATHSGVRPFICDVCNKGFNRKDILERHMVIHEKNRKKYKCVECNKLFSHSFVLKRHTRAVHSEEFQSVECPLCFKVIKCKENLVRHMKIHSGERAFSCDECGRRFTQKQHVIDHMVVHTGGKPHKCKYCDESFKHKRTLTRHLSKHAEYRPHICPQCSMGFAEKSMLNKHMAKHNMKRFQCSTCLMLFKLRTTLKRHKKRVHNEDISEAEMDSAETQLNAANNETNKKSSNDKKIVYVVVKKDKNNQTETYKVPVSISTQGNVSTVLHHSGKEETQTNGEVTHRPIYPTHTQAAEKIITQVSMETEERIAAGQQVADAMEEERSNIIQTLIEYAEREMKENSSQKPDQNDTLNPIIVTDANQNDMLSPQVVVENVAFAEEQEDHFHQPNSNAEVRQSTQSILADQSGRIYFEEAQTIEGAQSNAVVLSSVDNQSGIPVQLVGGETDLSQILILGQNNIQMRDTIIITHDETTNDIIVEQVQVEDSELSIT